MLIHYPSKMMGLVALGLIISLVCQGQTIHPAVGYKRTIGSGYYGTNVANVIDPQTTGVNDPNVLANFPKLTPTILRYPGGDQANWWNWHTGWWMNSVAVPTKWAHLPFKPNTLENLKPLLDDCHGTLVFLLNMVTDSLPDQLAMLEHADSIGIPVQYVEMGGELYPGQLPDDTMVNRLYPNAHVYGNVANTWIDTIKKHFPNAKFSVPACFNSYGAGAPLGLVQWNDTLFKYANHTDAISLHPYVDAEDQGADTLQVKEFAKDINSYLYQPFYMFNQIEPTSQKAAQFNKNIWNTEYNLSDLNRAVHGMWAQGLFIATQTLEFLYDTRITHVISYTGDGNGVHGLYFFDNTGFQFGGSDDGSNFHGPIPPPPTTPWAFTSAGNTMSFVGSAIYNAKYATPLSFSPVLNISYLNPMGSYNTYSMLYGWMLSTDAATSTIIMNYDSMPHTISTTELWPTGGTYQQRSAYALNYITGPSDVKSKNPTSLTSTITLPGYSITYVTGHDIPAPPPPNIHITATKTEMCEGATATLSVPSGYLKYLWSNGSTAKSITVSDEGEYWVRVWSSANGYYATDSTYITVNGLPKKPNIGQQGLTSFCKGGSVTLKLNNDPGNVTYLWSNGAKTSSITVTSSGNYYMFDIDSNGCQNVSDTIGVTVYPLPTPTIKAIGATTFCSGSSVDLAVNTGYTNYSWSNGKHGKTMDTLVVTTQGGYNCTVTDANGCTGTTSSINVTVFTVPNPTITANGATTFCSGGSVQLSTLTGYQKYQWQNGSGNISGATKQSYTATSGATYKATITDVNGCSATTLSGTKVTVNKLPTASITYNGNKNICNGSTYTLKAKTGTGYKFQWYKNGSKLSGATGSSYTVSQAGSYYYIVTSSEGCTSTSNTITFTANCRDAGDQQNATSGTLNVYPNPSTGNIVHIDLQLPDNAEQKCFLEIRNSLGELMMQRTINVSSGRFSYDWAPDEAIASGLYLVIVHTENETYHSNLVIAR